MAYDPTLSSFIVVAVVGGAAAVLNVSSEWELAHELSRATERWTKLAVVRVYAPDAKPDLAAREAVILVDHGYVAVPDPHCGPGSAAPATPPAPGAAAICYRRSHTA